MARITIQDCLENDKIMNHFELSVIASNRAKDIMSGAPLTIETNNDKAPVLALREIAYGTVDCDALRIKLFHKFQMKRSFAMEIEEDEVDKANESFLQDAFKSENMSSEDDESTSDELEDESSDDEAFTAYSSDSDENFDDNIDESIDEKNFTRLSI